MVGPNGALTTPTAFVSAFLTGYVESACVTPFEAVKVRMQVKENMGRYANSLQCARLGPESVYSPPTHMCAP